MIFVKIKNYEENFTITFNCRNKSDYIFKAQLLKKLQEHYEESFNFKFKKQLNKDQSQRSFLVPLFVSQFKQIFKENYL